MAQDPLIGSGASPEAVAPVGVNTRLLTADSEDAATWMSHEAGDALKSDLAMRGDVGGDASLSKIFGDIHAAISFIGKKSRLSQRCVDDAALAAISVIYKHRRRLRGTNPEGPAKKRRGTHASH